MNQMKYVVVESDEAGEQMFIFPMSISHDHFAEVLSNIRHFTGFDQWERIYRAPISAGFTDGVTCTGWSETLQLNSRPEDTILLKGGGQ